MKFGVNTFIWTVSFEHANLPLLPVIKESSSGFTAFRKLFRDQFPPLLL